MKFALWSTVWTWPLTARPRMSVFCYGADLQRVSVHRLSWPKTHHVSTGCRDCFITTFSSYYWGDRRPHGNAKIPAKLWSFLDPWSRWTWTSIAGSLLPGYSGENMQWISGRPQSWASIDPCTAQQRLFHQWQLKFYKILYDLIVVDQCERFVWKSMVNAARRICFCQSFVDLK